MLVWHLIWCSGFGSIKQNFIPTHLVQNTIVHYSYFIRSSSQLNLQYLKRNELRVGRDFKKLEWLKAWIQAGSILLKTGRWIASFLEFASYLAMTALRLAFVLFLVFASLLEIASFLAMTHLTRHCDEIASCLAMTRNSQWRVCASQLRWTSWRLRYNTAKFGNFHLDGI